MNCKTCHCETKCEPGKCKRRFDNRCECRFWAKVDKMRNMTCSCSTKCESCRKEVDVPACEKLLCEYECTCSCGHDCECHHYAEVERTSHIIKQGPPFIR